MGRLGEKGIWGEHGHDRRREIAEWADLGFGDLMGELLQEYV